MAFSVDPLLFRLGKMGHTLLLVLLPIFFRTLCLPQWECLLLKDHVLFKRYVVRILDQVARFLQPLIRRFSFQTLHVCFYLLVITRQPPNLNARSAYRLSFPLLVTRRLVWILADRMPPHRSTVFCQLRCLLGLDL